MTTVRTHRFGDDFAEQRRRRWADRPVHERPLTYDIAVLDEFADRRAWYAEQLELLPEHAGNTMGRRLWKDEHIWSCTLELATGAWLRGCGYEAAYERDGCGVPRLRQRL
jgi:hypothetical protein